MQNHQFTRYGLLVQQLDILVNLPNEQISVELSILNLPAFHGPKTLFFWRSYIRTTGYFISKHLCYWTFKQNFYVDYCNIEWHLSYPTFLCLWPQQSSVHRQAPATMISGRTGSLDLPFYYNFKKFCTVAARICSVLLLSLKCLLPTCLVFPKTWTQCHRACAPSRARTEALWACGIERAKQGGHLTLAHLKGYTQHFPIVLINV